MIKGKAEGKGQGVKKPKTLLNVDLFEKMDKII